jgi:hypothetical protein
MVGVMVAADSPLGRAAEAINAMARHLPDPGLLAQCSTCANRFWPCEVFQDAATSAYSARLRVLDVVPFELHSRLRPSDARQTTSSNPAWPSVETEGETERG